jgi:diguanylate cyclase (GGDEF)-like protein/PAS domain S-box-containing protein
MRKTDKFIWLLVVFAFLLISLFTYLQKIDSDIKNYDTYHAKLENMIILDQQMENLFLKAYRYIDYDEISIVLKKFEKNIYFLENGNIQEEFGMHIYKDIKIIKNVYFEKLTILEHFKTYNARAVNSIHYLYDLRKTIDELYLKDRNKQEQMNQIFFTIGQKLMDIPINEIKLKSNMQVLKNYSSEHKELVYFYQHSKQFLSDIEMIHKDLEKNKNVKLSLAITHVLTHIEDYYDINRYKHKVITFSFFVLAFLILIILVFNYHKVRKTTRALQSFRYAIENSDNAIVITDTDRKIEYVNEAFEKLTGYVTSEVVGENPNILKSDLVSDSVYKDMNETLDRGEKWQGELINRRKDGTLLYEKASIVPVFIEDELVKYLAIKLDISTYIKNQKILQQSAKVYETIEDGIVITNSKKKIISVNTAFTDIFGYSEEELLGKDPMIVTSLKQDSVFYKKMWYSLQTKDRWAGRISNKTKDGRVIPLWLTIAVVRDKNNNIQNFIAIYTNLKKIIEMEEKAEYLAYHDSLTKLPNRTYFEERIVDVLELAKINKNKVAVLFIDLDRFKVINDTLGHHAGDGMLVELSERLKNVLGKDDILARIGGDEFVVIVNEIKDKKEAGVMAAKILSVVREPIKVQDYHLNTTASIGIAIYPNDGENRNEIIKHADSAMYHAKDKGKDNYQFYTEQLSLDVETRLDLEQELLHALEKEELMLYYQPQYCLENRKISGAEVLLRWKNKKLGWISPDEFIPIAEETGVIVSIGYFVFEKACREYMNWEKLGLNINSISINISSLQFREDDLFKRLKDIILKVGIPAHKIEIEITERFIMEYSTTNLTILEDLRNIGCKISIDDFGTGYSSMSYMKKLALDTIKIDKSFVTDLPGDLHDAEVSKAIIALSKSLGYQVVAEGIETVEQEEFLRHHNCDIGQGFYFARPMESADFISFVKGKNNDNV